MLQSLDKLFVIGLIAILLLGPTRLPTYAAKLAGLVRTVRGMADQARERMRDEMGPEFDDIDWQKLDPRQYDPRRIIRDALLDSAVGSTVVDARPQVSAGNVRAPAPVVPLAEGELAPFDAEAT